MKNGAKSVWKLPQIMDKINRGTDGIEIQLQTNNPYKEMSEILPENVLKMIKAIHLPLEYQNGVFFDYSVDTFDGQEMLKGIMKKLTEIGIAKNNIHIICHYHGDKEILKRYKLYDNVVSFMQEIADEYKDCIFCVENTTHQLTTWNNNNVTLVKDINKDNVGTCLDTCHALIVEKNGLFAGQIGNTTNITLENHFKANKDLCKHIHLCNASWDSNNRYGYKKGHGTIFTENDFDLKRIVNLYKQYNYDADIVFEVYENDYLNCENFSKTKDAFQKVFK